MVCDIDSNGWEFELIVTLITSCTGVLFTILSVVCIITNTEIDRSLRSILLSFSIANFMGTAMLAYDNITLICHHKKERLHFMMTISVMLSLSHLMLLMLSEYINLTSNRRRRARDFTGLIIISWIISITIGMMNVVSHEQARIVFAAIFLLIVLFLAVSYLVVINKHRKKKRLQQAYQHTFLRKDLRTTKVIKRIWMLRFFAIIIFSYAGCSILWVINELREGFQKNTVNSFIHSTSLIIYSLNFYFPSAICVYLRCMQWLSRKNTTLGRVQSYRYRDAFWNNAHQCICPEINSTYKYLCYL